MANWEFAGYVACKLGTLFCAIIPPLGNAATQVTMDGLTKAECVQKLTVSKHLAGSGYCRDLTTGETLFVWNVP